MLRANLKDIVAYCPYNVKEVADRLVKFMNLDYPQAFKLAKQMAESQKQEYFLKKIQK